MNTAVDLSASPRNPVTPNTAKTGWAPGDLRIANQWSIYTALFDTDARTVPELAAVVDVTRPTVAAGLLGLERAGLINNVGTRTGSAGRAPQLYSVDPATAWVVAVEIGRQRLRVALADLLGTVVRRIDIPTTNPDHTPSVEALADEIEALLHSHRVDIQKNLVRVVVASPGIYLPKKKRFYHNVSLPGLSTEAFIDELRNRLQVPVLVENDANMAALGELASGRGVDISTFVYVHVGVGVGLGIVVKGELHRGAHHAAGEPLFMHFHSTPNPEDPTHAHAPIDGDDLVAFARRSGDEEADSAADVLARAYRHDRAATEALENELDYLTELLIPVISILDPEKIIFGGPVGDQLGGTLPSLHERLSKAIPLASPKLEIAALGPDAPLQGIITSSLNDARRAAFETLLTL